MIKSKILLGTTRNYNQLLVVFLVIAVFIPTPILGKCPPPKKRDSAFYSQPLCRQMHKLARGTKCRTKKGGTFEKMPDGWRDTGPGGILWSKSKFLGKTQTKAQQECQKLGKRLPTVQEFNNAEKHGIREVLASYSGSFLWSSTTLQEKKMAYGFSMSIGKVATVPETFGEGVGYIYGVCVE